MDFDDLDFPGPTSTQEFDMSEGSALEGFLSGEKPKKIDPKEEEAKRKAEAEAKAKEKAASKKEPLKEEEEPEEELDVLNELSEEDKQKIAKKKPEGDSEEEAGDETAENEFQVIGKQLYELGIFTADEEGTQEIPESGERLAEMFQEASQKGATTWLQSFLSSRGEDRMDLFNAIFINGVDPREYMPLYNEVMDYEAMDIKLETNQERVYREYYKRLKWAPEKIEARLQKAKDYGDLEEEATDLKEKIVEQDKESLSTQEESKKQAAEAKKLETQQYNTSIQKILVEGLKQKEIKGIPISEKLATDVANFLTKPAYKMSNGELLTEFDNLYLESKKPENVQQRVVMALLHLTGYDFSKIEKRAISKESSEVFAGLKKVAAKSKTTKVSQPPNYWDSLK